MKPPDKAVILAAGYGERLLPLTRVRPKPLVPIWGKPVLRHAMEMLRSWGVRDVLVNAHYHAGALLEYLRSHPVPGLRIQISFEPEILGTGGPLVRARWFTGMEPFWMMNADVLADVNPAAFRRAFTRKNVIAALWMHPSRGPRTVEITRDTIRSFHSRNPGSPGTCTFCGLQLLSPRILQYLPPSGFSSIIQAYEKALQSGERIAPIVTPDAFWADIGTPASYLEAHSEIRSAARRGQSGARLFSAASCRSTGKIWIATEGNVTLSPQARLWNSVVWDRAVIGPRADIRNAIITGPATVNEPLEYMALPAAGLGDETLDSLLRELGWDPAATVLNPLPPRGSARSFTRLLQGRRRAILIRYSTERPENAFYAGHARFLARHSVRVPAVLADHPEANLCILEDAGHDSIESLAPSLSPARLRTLYLRTLEAVLRLHGPATRAAARTRMELCPAFDRRLFLWEHNLFCEEFLQRHCKLPRVAITNARAELENLLPTLLAAPPVLLHRDLQSSNVLVVRGQPVLIDFQGMRFGPAAYDLASLFHDPYVNLPESLVQELLGIYIQNTPDGNRRRAELPVAAAQRLAQALGAYGRLGHNPATAGFLRHIPAGVRQFLAAARSTGLLPGLCRTLERWQDEQEPRQ